MDFRLETCFGQLPDAEQHLAFNLTKEVGRCDGIDAFGEVQIQALTSGSPTAVHLLAWIDGHLAGYAQGEVSSDSVELAVHPHHRRQGVASAMIGHCLEGGIDHARPGTRSAPTSQMPATSREAANAHDTAGGVSRTSPGSQRQTRWWAHGDLPAAQAAARRLDLVPVRQMVKMTAPVDTAWTETTAQPPPGTQWHRFTPGSDEAAWVELNAAAFAGHPEQGQLTEQDLAWRMDQDWFDPEGFWLLRDQSGGSNYLGYIWTKVTAESAPASASQTTSGPLPSSDRGQRDPSAAGQPGQSDGGTGARYLGEIYAIGVHPEAQGRRLGTALLARGLERLAKAGVSQIDLYVEADNAPALAAYRRQGFETSQRHVQYARRVSAHR
ncbi:MAG: mycothiol synthase [Micrococcales bacterium]|nr:mycothiol synthase [Micrococcales bacterium]